MKKNLLCSLILSVTMVAGGTSVSFAAEAYNASENSDNIVTSIGINNQALIIDIPQELIKRSKQYAEDQILLGLKEQRTPEYEYKLEKVGTNIAVKTRIGYAAGQPSGGTVFGSKGGFYWSDGGNDINVSFSVGYGPFSLSVSPGKVGTGTWIESPYINTAVKLVIYKDITVTKYAKYRKSIMGNGAKWEYIGTEYSKIPTKNYLEVVKVN